MKTTGVVKWFDYTKGYGFVSPDNGSKDVFIHRSTVEVWKCLNKDLDT